MEWLKQQGPWCPALVDYLRAQHQQYDVLVFMTYLYATTVTGLPICPSRSILVPTTHDEPAARLSIYQEVFAAPAALMLNTEIERQFVHAQFSERPLLEEIVGVGVEIPPQQQHGRGAMRMEEASETASSPDEVGSTPEYVPSHLAARGAEFRRKHRLHGPILLYGGRIDPGKGCEELIEYFSSYVQEGGDATLALMGAKLMVLPEEPFIRFAGLLSERERAQAFEAATVVVCPSPYESLSMLALEAMAAGTPILVNARSPVLVEHCLKGNGGLFYANRDEFVECLKLLVDDEGLRMRIGRQGREYVRQNYRWDVILGKYERVFAKLRNAR
jgi:glycosyltransferase involved in cell wall biosynthesis